MIINDKKWLERQIGEWAGKGWITAEGAENIRQSCRRSAVGTSGAVVYMALAVVTLSIAGMAMIWGISYMWYHIPAALRMAAAAAILLLSQGGMALAMFQNRQGTWLGEGTALAGCAALFVSLALAEQTFYVGWNMTAYIAACAVLCLPAAYLLRSVGTVLVYCAAVLVWAALSGPFADPGDAALIWLFLILPLPMYNVFSSRKDERRLSVFSWAVTITVFVAFALTMRHAAYIPFLLSSALAAVIMLAGYSIDIRKSWGVPFRWFGRFAAAASLLISCLPASWYGVADIQGFHWSTMTIMVLLFLAIVALLAKGVKKRFWGPVIYSFVPFILLGETMVVRSGLYSSVPLMVSTAYMMCLGFYEVMQGMREKTVHHLRFGVLILVSVVLAFLFSAAFSPFVPLVVIAVFVLVVLWRRRAAKTRSAAEQRAARRSQVRPAATLRSEPERTGDGAGAAAAEEEAVPEWLQDVSLPESPKAPAEPMRPAGTVIPREAPRSQFVPPVFRSPDDMVLPSLMTDMRREEKRAARKAEKAGPSGSPWQTAPPAKREKHFTQSPWAQEGDAKK